MAATLSGKTEMPRDDKQCPRNISSLAPGVILVEFKVNAASLNLR